MATWDIYEVTLLRIDGDDVIVGEADSPAGWVARVSQDDLVLTDDERAWLERQAVTLPLPSTAGRGAGQRRHASLKLSEEDRNENILSRHKKTLSADKRRK